MALGNKKSNAEDDLSSLERVRTRLYQHKETAYNTDAISKNAQWNNEPRRNQVPHSWKDETERKNSRAGMHVDAHSGVRRHMRLAHIFFMLASIFFVASLFTAGLLIYFGGKSVSVDKLEVTFQGPATIAGGDTVPLSFVLINRNPTAIDNVIVQIDFPPGTRDASNPLVPYPRYIEELETIQSGETVSRSIRVVMFGEAGQTLDLPGLVSFSVAGSNAVFEKKVSYDLVIASTPLSISVDTVSETVSGKPIMLALTVRSNATIRLPNVAVEARYPFGFNVTSSSVPSANGSIYFIGTLEPGTSKTMQISGTLAGQEGEQRVFRFTAGTVESPNSSALAITYMTQDASVLVTSPFISTVLSIGGDTSANMVIVPGRTESVSVMYTNTLPTSIANATILVAISGAAVDYNSIRSSNGFYRSSDHTIVFSRDTDSAFANLAPGASGTGSFTFSTLPTSELRASPSVMFTVSVAGTRIGQANVPEEITATTARTIRVATGVSFIAESLHSPSPIPSHGSIPPRVGAQTTYTIQWKLRNGTNRIAGSVVSATLPSYVSYTGQTAGAGSFRYDSGSRTVSWNVGDIAQGASVEGAFQVSIIPSVSQRGTAPALTGAATFSGHDRFAGVQVSAHASAVTTEAGGSLGDTRVNGIVQ